MPGYLLPWISLFSTYIPLAAALILIARQRLTKDLKVLLLFLAVAGATEAIAMVYAMRGAPNHGILHIYTPIETGLVLLLLSLWQRSEKARTYIQRGIVVYLILYAMVKIFQLEEIGPATINHLTRPLSQLFVGGVAFYTLHQLWYFSERQLYKDYRFWIIAAFLIYNIVGVVIFALTVVKDRQALFFLAYLHALANIAHNLLFTAGLFCAMRFQPELVD